MGARSLERMGVQEALTNLTREFKPVPWGRMQGGFSLPYFTTAAAAASWNTCRISD